ncbi:universal stress protein [Saccharomonospora sp. NPDC006951]
MNETVEVVAGVDGSASSVNAAVWAAEEARNRGWRLRLVHAYSMPPSAFPGFLAAAAPLRDKARERGRLALETAEQEVKSAVGGGAALDVIVDLFEGGTVATLVRYSENAGLLVVGSRGLGGFAELATGSVAIALASHAHCPVAVVRGRKRHAKPAESGPVVVGVDGSTTSTAAVAFAAREAGLRETGLVLVHTWTHTPPNPPDSASGEEKDVAARVKAELEADVALCERRFPGVRVEVVAERGKPVRALLARSETARLLVVGSRGRGGFAGMLLGSTSQSMVTHARCPVVVVPDEVTDIRE